MHRVALRRARDGLLRQRDGIAGLGLLQAHAHVQAGQQARPGVGQFGTQRDLAGGGVHRQVGEQQLAGQGVFGAVVEHARARWRPRPPARLNWPLSSARRSR
jgi:hypothetical protein